MKDYIDYEAKVNLADIANTNGITLNGNPAQVSGTVKPFATVTDTTTGLSAQWSWHAVRHVLLSAEGAFKS